MQGSARGILAEYGRVAAKGKDADVADGGARSPRNATSLVSTASAQQQPRSPAAHNVWNSAGQTSRRGTAHPSRIPGAALSPGPTALPITLRDTWHRLGALGGARWVLAEAPHGVMRLRTFGRNRSPFLHRGAPSSHTSTGAFCRNALLAY
jgi:hypothetical protein